MSASFASGRDYRGGNGVYLAMNAMERGYADPCWGGFRQIQEAGGHVRKGEKGTPIMCVDFRQRRTARDVPLDPLQRRPSLIDADAAGHDQGTTAASRARFVRRLAATA